MNAASQRLDSLDSQDVCTIVVLYDGDVTRTRALAACDYLVKQFWQELELKFHWWRTDFLRDGNLAAVAADNAAESDFLIICSQSDREFSPALESWFESWLARRSGREGALVELSVGSGAQRAASRRQSFLREVCERGGFDYLTAMPEAGPVATSANRMLDLLDEFRPPTHYGLNE